MQENKISRFLRNDEFSVEAKTCKSRRLLCLNPGSVETRRVELDSASRSAVPWRTDLGGGGLALPARLGLQAPGRAAHRSSQSLSPGASGQEALLSRQGSRVLLYGSHGSGWTALK